LVTIFNSREIETSSTRIQTGKWYHVITTLSLDGMTVKLDGEIQLVKTTANTEYKAHDSVKIKIGQYPNMLNSLKAFKKSKMNLDNIVMWDRVLSEEESKDIYLLGFGKF